MRCTGYIYPALLTALVPFRSYILSRVFSEEDLKYLDPTAETEKEHQDEQRKIRHNRNDSFDSDQSDVHFGHFHPEALQEELKDRHEQEGIEVIQPPAVEP